MFFLNPGILWALTALAIPVLIHLFNFQRTERILFANTRLLSEVIQNTNRTRQVKNLLLLLCRLLGLLFLILAFAQPTWKNSASVTSDGLAKVCVYVDNSSSMFLPDDGNRAFEKSVASAAGVPLTFGNKGWFEILSNDFFSKHIWTSASGFRDQTTELGPSSESRSVPLILNRAKRQFQLQNQEGTRHLYLFSDFQKKQMGDLSVLAKDSGIRIHLHALQHPVKNNVWIDSVWLPKPISPDSKENNVRIALSNAGSTENPTVRIQLLANGNLLSGKVVTLNKTGTTLCNLPVKVKPGEKLNCILQLDDPEIAFDNQFYFTLQAPKPIRTYLLTSRASSPIEKVYSDKNLFVFSRSGFNNPDYKTIENADLIIVENPDQPDNALTEKLGKKIREGGSVLLVPGTNPDWFSGFANQSGLSITSISSRDKPENWKIGLPGKENAFFKDIFQESAQNKIKPYSIPEVSISGGTSLLKYESGESFLVEKKQENGSLFVLASDVSTKSGTLVSHPLMIPLFYRLAFASAHTDDNPLYVHFNQTRITLPLDSLPSGTESAVELIHENQKFLGNLVKSNQTIQLEIPETSLQPGFWEVRKSNSLLATIAVNQNKVESDPSFYTLDELKELFKDKPWIQIESIGINSSPEHLKNERNDETPLWKYFVLLALLMFCLEVILLRFKRKPVVG